MKKISKQQSFTVYCSTTLTTEDVKILTLLYSPIIKDKALNLYLILSSLVERSSLGSYTSPHQLIFDLAFLTESEFYSARIKLEAIGLLKTMLDKDKLIYLLKSPLTAKQFLVDGALGVFLLGQLGEKTYERISKMFNLTKVEKDSYEEITKTFDDVFQSDVEYNKNESTDYVLGRNVNNGIKIVNHTFDYKKFVKNIKNVIDSKKASSKKFEKYITDMAYAYAFDEDIMANVYRQSIDSQQNIDYHNFSKNCLDEFQFQYNKGVPKAIVKEEDEMYKMLSETSGIELLKQFTNYKAPLPDDVEKLAKLYSEFENVDRAVLNLVIIHVLKIKEGEVVPAYNYFKTVITSLQKQNITTFAQAKEYYYGNAQTKSNVKSAAKKPKSNPKNSEWLNEYMENIEGRVRKL